MAPSFTVLIPTRDRADTLIHTVRSALAQDYPDFEVLVSDNSASAETRDALGRLCDKRLRVIFTGGGLSMSHHWEFALEHVQTAWVTMLGDDDGLLPGALQQAARIVGATGTRAIRSNGCSYSWPGLTSSPFGRLRVSVWNGYKRLDSKRALQDVLNGRLHYTNLPVLYNGGFVDCSLISEAKHKTGRFYHSMIPDVYSGIVFALLTESYIYSQQPLAVNGASHHSGGTASFEKRKVSRKYDPAEKFYTEPNMPLHADVPVSPSGRPVRSIQATVYEAFRQAIDVHGQPSGGVHTTPADQLPLILRGGGPDLADLRLWADAFIAQHGLQVSKASIDRCLLIGSWENKLATLIGMTRSLWSEHVFHGSPQSPLNNVYESCCVAAFSRANKLCRINNVIRRIQHYAGQTRSELL
jgi:hypothetical protein